ncbi:ABC transporter substrate-binding protein [Stappia sp. ICDLI1TA098]
MRIPASLFNQKMKALASPNTLPPKRNVSKFRQLSADEKGIRCGSPITGVFWYSSADLAIDPYVAGVNAVPGWMLSTLGVSNAVTSREEWPTVGWETIATADPAFIVAADMERRRLPADDIAVKRAFLASDPLTREMDAVKEGRIIVIDANAIDPSVRSIFALEALAQALS